MDDIAELLKRKEELLPELKPYINTTSHGMVVLQHPLVYSVPYMEPMNAMLNAQYALRKKEVEKLKDAEDWYRYIFMYERPYRFQAFASIDEKLSDQDYWQILRWIWQDSENIWQNHEHVDNFLNSERPQRDKFMDEDEHKFFNALPDEFIVYRGHQIKNKIGWSWTLNYNKALWFSMRFARSKKHHVVQATVKKKNVIGVLLSRSECEIVIRPAHVFKVKTVKQLEPKDLQFFRELAKEQFTLPSSDHGPSHWVQVEYNAIALCKHVSGADVLVCRLFAIFHDCQRKNEHDDPEHGLRAANFIKDNQKILGLNPKQLETLVYACTFHDKGMVSDDPTTGVCWDADRLDLLRVGIVPDIEFLSTEAAKKFQWQI